ncbi:hypothetical protein BGX28_003276 [Mortierella sp. GBA30]|nr:hypothetical protein BGX28_003276 [Mortierella sp. GBA30]
MYNRKDALAASKRSSSMNPLAATFTPTLPPKPTIFDCALVPESGSEETHKQSVDSRSLSRQGSADSVDALITGLGISSPANSTFRGQYQQERTESVGTTASDATVQKEMTLVESSPLTTSTSNTNTNVSAMADVHDTNAGVVTTASEFDPDEFQKTLIQHISDKLETGLDRHLSQLVPSRTTDSISGHAKHSYPSTSEILPPPSSSMFAPSPDEAIITHLKSLLRHTNTELDRLKDKNQSLLEDNQQLERKHLEATHQVARLQDLEKHHQFLVSRVKELETNGDVSSSMDLVLETASMNGQRLPSRHGSSAFARSTRGSVQESQHVHKLQRELETLISERDALKIRSWELEKRPFALQSQQPTRSMHFIDLENERNRLLEELSQKTVAMEDLFNKNEALTVRAKEYEKRVWELESQVASLEANTTILPQLRTELVSMETRVAASEALVAQFQAMEGGQVALVKALQERISELETTNAELEHSNWDLSEKLNIANNQHALLTKEFESFRCKEKDDRRLEFLVARNRDLEALLAEHAKIQPDYKEEYDRVSSELEKIKVRMPQLEGQAKQVALLRAKTSQLEKQIKTMESLEPRLEEMQQLHERNLFLESELGELEQLRAKEMELELELEESKARLLQLGTTQKTRMNSLSGLRPQQVLQQHAKATGRLRSGSVAQPGPPFMLYQPHQLQQEKDDATGSSTAMALDYSGPDMGIRNTSDLVMPQHSRTASCSDAAPSSPKSPRRDFPVAMTNNTTTTVWPSGRSSVNLSNHSLHRMSSSSSSSSSSSTAVSTSSVANTGDKSSLKLLPVTTPVGSRESSPCGDDEERKIKDPMTTTDEPETFNAVACAPAYVGA